MRDSQVEHWYNCWSVVAQEEPEWKKYGEWGAFWREYLHEPNFRCPNGFASCNYQPPSIQEIRRMFPNNRPLGRRVLFTTLIYELMHSYTNDLEVRFKDTDLRFQTLLPDIIQTFTLQVKSDKATLCEIYRQIINSAINVVMDLSIAAFTDGVGQVLTSKLFNLIEKNVFRMANYMNAEKLERALAAAGNAFDHINWEKFDWEKEYSTIHKQITEHMWGRDKILSTLRAEFHHIEHDVGTHAYDSLRDAKHSAIAAHFLHDTFSHVDENGDDSTKRALQETMEYFSKNGFPRAVLKASKLPSKEGREIRKEARHAITIFRKLSFAPSKLAQEWGAPMTTNVVGQLAIWPMFHLPQQWAASFYHPGNYWGKHIGGAEDPPEWHNERMPEHTRESGPVDNVNGPGWQNSLINEAYRAWPRNKLTEKHEQVASGLDGTLEAALPTIVGGIGSGWICSDFEGDWKDDNKVNTELLRDRVSVELEAGRRQVWTLFKDMYDGAVPEPGRPSMVARWMLARNWVGKDQKGSIEYDLHNIEDFHKKFELGYVKDLASSVLASGYNYLKCSHREDAVEKCAKGGLEYQQIFCPEPETDPTLVCQAARWYFSNTAPHEIDMVAIDSISRFGAMHGFRFNREDMLAEMWANYKHYGNEGIKREWGVEALEHDDHPRGFRLPVCMYEDNAYDVHHHQRAWWKNWNFPATCGNYAANETADFMKAVSLKPGSTKHSSTDWTFADRIPRVLWNRTPYTVYMSMCELGIRWPNKDHDDIHFWNRYTLKASKDEPEEWRNCGKKGWPSCPEDHENRDWGDQDCALVKYSTLYMDELEANIAFCANSIGHTIFSREAPHIWTGLVPLTAWKNNEHQCEKWLEKNGMQALETISRRTLEAAEMGIVDPSHPEVSSDKDVQFNLDKLTA
ncbi:hypothetical protein N431DRAFT_398235 [Stipitochalara longipes BDJ]|nr:hypothetical protein N431DRAFT_398235 [Stipitochalara longipes BDJ]